MLGSAEFRTYGPKCGRAIKMSLNRIVTKPVTCGCGGSMYSTSKSDVEQTERDFAKAIKKAGGR